MDTKCGNLSLMVESLLEILTKRRRQAFYKPVDPCSLTNAADMGISSTSTLNIVNKLGKHNFSCN